MAKSIQRGLCILGEMLLWSLTSASRSFPILPRKGFILPFATLKMFACLISSWLASSPTSLEFNCAAPQFSKQISPHKTQTFEANCNLIQLKR